MSPLGTQEPEKNLSSFGDKKSSTFSQDEKHEKDFSLRPFKREIVWPNTLGFLAAHLIATHALYIYFFVISWKLFIYSTFLGVLVSQGVTMGAHRHFAHRAFKATRAFSAFLLLLQTMSSQNCLWVWVRDHRQHHKYSDTDGDPHNASNGFFFSHVGWLMSKKHPLVLQKGKAVDMSDLEADPMIMFQKRYYKTLWFFFSFLLPTWFPVYVMGESWYHCIMVPFLLRIVLVLNFTWMVNSWAHKFGTKPYEKNFLAAETLVVSVVAFGEGWHNYHHVFPWDYRASEYGVSYNPTTVFIDICAYFGWIYDRREATTEMIIARANRTGDGSLAVCQRGVMPESQCKSGRSRG